MDPGRGEAADPDFNAKAHTMKTLITGVAVAAMAIGLAGCNSTQKDDGASAGAMKPVNTKCPIVPGDTLNNNVFTMYKGQKVAFCCPGCIEDWNTLSDELKDEKLARAK